MDHVNILSDSDSDSAKPSPNFQTEAIDLTTPSPLPKKKQRISPEFLNPSNRNVFIIDDDEDPSPLVVAETPLSSFVKCSGEGVTTELRVVPDTPMSELFKSDYSIVKCNTNVPISEPLISNRNSEVSIIKCNTSVPVCEPALSSTPNHNSAELGGLIQVDSDDESEDIGGFQAWKLKENIFASKLTDELELESRFAESSSFIGSSFQFQENLSTKTATDKTQLLQGCSSPSLLEDDIYVACADSADKANILRSGGQSSSEQQNNEDDMKGKKKADEAKKQKRISKDERLRLKEEKKQQQEQEKLLRAASKAEAAEMNKKKKEMQKWEKGKYALKSIVAEIDKKVVEMGSIGGHLLTRFAEKGLSYRITSNPVERSIIWSMVVPEDISGITSEPIEISYVLIIYEAEEFCNLVTNEVLMDHVHRVQQSYPHHTICYLTNRLMAYINKREQAQYKNPANHTGWKRPAIEETLAKLTTDFFKVHSRQCVDEAELAEHVVGLTSNLASCQFRKKSTRLSVNANGSAIPKDCIDKNLIKKNLWLKALVAIPKVQPRFAIAIWKKYPTMKSLLSIYMDSAKSVHEKEFLLKDLTTESLLGDDRRLGEVCSKRIYRILMAQSGSTKTDDVENGADFFGHRS